jgi:LysR family transcriptional activator of nhaA
MDWLNYHHLLYFWHVVREGGVLPASRVLKLAHPTVSAQVKQLETALGEALFDRTGRRLEPTETGRVVYRYADEIFALGRELVDTVQGRPSGRPVRLVVGIAEVMPKLVVRRLLEPVFALPEPVHLVCQEDRFDRLQGDLARLKLDLLLTDAPLPPGTGIRAFNHLLCECGVSFFASDGLASQLRQEFPQNLDGTPFLLPAEETVLRRSLEQWFDEQGIRPERAAEFQDSALLKVFGQEGKGAFCAPSVIEDAVKRQYGVHVLGRTPDIRERFYAVSMERRVKHPAVKAICESAKKQRFDLPPD